MTKISEKDRDRIIEILSNGMELPIDYKNVLFPPEKKEYELVYEGKEREEDIIADTMAVPLQPIKTFGQDGKDWVNKLIFGDNLQAMKALLDDTNVKGKVKLIYIDPPFATKQEFRGSQDQKAYQDKIAGARFVEFLRKRLILLKELLADDGSIYVHLDWKKAHYMKVILDEVFGENKFRNEIIWKRKGGSANPKNRLGVVTDTIFWYSKSDKIIINQQYTLDSDEVRKYIEERFNNEEKDGRKFMKSPIVSPNPRPNLTYDYKGYKPPINGWSIARNIMERWDKDGKLYFPPKGKGERIYRKIYIDEYIGQPIQNLWTDIFVINPVAKERKDVNYPTQKPSALLERIINTSTNKGDIVLDAFAGSGTTLAVAEKLGRKWIGIDCGKLAIYTIQKRILNLKKDIGQKGKSLKPKSFTVYNAGLYDFSKLKKLPWKDWRLFALHLFNCRDKKHTVSGIELDGIRGNSDVLVFNHLKDGGVVLDYGFIDDLHSMLGNKTSKEFFIIAPAASVTFLENYIEKGDIRYYILRIPYSIVNELHTREFEAIQQPIDESQVNDTVDAVGFDFIRAPKVRCEYNSKKDTGIIKINTFKSEAMLKGASQLANRESLSFVMVDFDYDDKEQVFNLDTTIYTSEIEKNNWEIHLPLKSMKDKMMLIYLDIYGNEYREIKTKADFK